MLDGLVSKAESSDVVAAWNEQRTLVIRRTLMELLYPKLAKEAIEATRKAVTADGVARYRVRLPRAGGGHDVGWISERLRGGARDAVCVVVRHVVRGRPLRYRVVRPGGAMLRATSSLDGESERLVHEALEAQRRGGGGGGGGRTAVIVAHRLSSVLCAQRVAVLRDGRIEQLGTPSELAAQTDGWYYQNFYAAAGKEEVVRDDGDGEGGA